MTFFLFFIQLVLVLLKFQGTISWPWLTVLIPMQIHGIAILIRIAASLVAFAFRSFRRSMMTEEQKATEDLAQSLRKLSSKLK